MKLDKIRFAMLVGYIQKLSDGPLSVDEIAAVDNMIDVEMPQPEPYRATEASVDELLRQIASPDGFISAIKAYRVLTGAGLKEAKEAIERYRSYKPLYTPPRAVGAEHTLGDILHSGLKQS